MQTKLSEVLKHKGRIVHSVAPESTVRDAVRLMNRLRIGAVLVVDEGQLAGIFTERDVLVRVVAGDLDSRTTLVRDVMTSNVTTVSPDMRVGEALRLITERRTRHLPVVENRQLLGVVSIGDLSNWATLALQSEVAALERSISARAEPTRMAIAP